MSRSIYVILTIAFVLAIVGCTVIFNNRGTVEVKDADSHDAGTNSRAIDLNISPR